MINLGVSYVPSRPAVHLFLSSSSCGRPFFYFEGGLLLESVVSVVMLVEVNNCDVIKTKCEQRVVLLFFS